MPVLLEGNPLGRALLFHLAKKTVLKKSKGHYPAPLIALKAVKKGFRKPLRKGLEIEARLFGDIIGSPVSKNLIKIFFWSESVKKENGTTNPDIKVKPVKKAAGLGAGVMGGGIAQLFASRGIPFRVKDISYEAVAKAYQQASQILYGKLKRRRLSKLEYQHTLGMITGTIDYSGFKSADFIIEAIIEKLDLKKAVFKEIEDHLFDFV